MSGQFSMYTVDPITLLMLHLRISLTSVSTLHCHQFVLAHCLADLMQNCNVLHHLVLLQHPSQGAFLLLFTSALGEGKEHGRSHTWEPYAGDKWRYFSLRITLLSPIAKGISVRTGISLICCKLCAVTLRKTGVTISPALTFRFWRLEAEKQFRRQAPLWNTFLSAVQITSTNL